MAGYKSFTFDPDEGAAASDLASAASDAASKASNAASKASQGVLSNASAASDAGSKALAASDKASKASSAASNALSRISARSAVWDRKTVVLKPMDYSTVVEDGDGMRFVVPGDLNGMDLVSVGAHVYTAPTSGVMKIYISNITTASQILSSEMQIDVSEKDTITASSAAVIDTGEDDVSTGDELRIYASDAASGASGLEVRLAFEKP